MISPITPLCAPGLGSTGASFALDSTGTLMLLLKEGFPPPILIFKGEDDLCRTMQRLVRRECWRNTAKFLEEGMFSIMHYDAKRRGDRSSSPDLGVLSCLWAFASLIVFGNCPRDLITKKFRKKLEGMLTTPLYYWKRCPV